MSTDLLLDDRFQLVAQSNGDAALTASDNACFLQSLRVEAASAEGDLWYAPEWGWSLLRFAGQMQDELTELELEQHVRVKLRAHEEIDVASIAVTSIWAEDTIAVHIMFRLLTESELRQLGINIGRTEIEVTILA